MVDFPTFGRPMIPHRKPMTNPIQNGSSVEKSVWAKTALRLKMSPR
jgi:hypothetical protein